MEIETCYRTSKFRQGYCIGYRIGMDLVNLMERSNPTEKGSNPRDKLILRGLNPRK